MTQEGTVSPDCGGQQTFTCRGDRDYFPVFWTLHGLHGITTDNNTFSTGYVLAKLNERTSSPDKRKLTSSSNITISGFTDADDGGTIITYLIGKRNCRRKSKTITVSIGKDVT